VEEFGIGRCEPLSSDFPGVKWAYLVFVVTIQKGGSQIVIGDFCVARLLVLFAQFSLNGVP